MGGKDHLIYSSSNKMVMRLFVSFFLNINVAIHFNLPNHSIDDMIISALLYAPTEKLPRKT